jgi:hypothetical protein
MLEVDVRYKIFMVMTILMMFLWVKSPLVEANVSEKHAEDGCSMHLQNVVFYQPLHPVI